VLQILKNILPATDLVFNNISRTTIYSADAALFLAKLNLKLLHYFCLGDLFLLAKLLTKLLRAKLLTK